MLIKYHTKPERGSFTHFSGGLPVLDLSNRPKEPALSLSKGAHCVVTSSAAFFTRFIEMGCEGLCAMVPRPERGSFPRSFCWVGACPEFIEGSSLRGHIECRVFHAVYRDGLRGALRNGSPPRAWVFPSFVPFGVLGAYQRSQSPRAAKSSRKGEGFMRN